MQNWLVLVNGSVPLALLAWDTWQGRLGADPVNHAIHTTGMPALIFLLLSLTVTPLRLATGWNWLSHFRRMLGLFAFFYGVLHLSIYFAFDRRFSISATIADTLKHRYILFGMGALLLMVPLAVTSTNGMIKRLGSARWKRLHQLVYISATCGVLHYYMLVKRDIRLPLAFVGAGHSPRLPHRRQTVPHAPLSAQTCPTTGHRYRRRRLIPPPSPAQMRSRAAPAPPS